MRFVRSVRSAKNENLSDVEVLYSWRSQSCSCCTIVSCFANFFTLEILKSSWPSGVYFVTLIFLNHFENKSLNEVNNLTFSSFKCPVNETQNFNILSKFKQDRFFLALSFLFSHFFFAFFDWKQKVVEQAMILLWVQ